MMRTLTSLLVFKAGKMTDRLCEVVKGKLREEDGAFIEEAIKILTGVVIGALLLAGIYFLFNNIIIPTLNERVTDMFDYAG